MMTTERMGIFGLPFPRGFERVVRARRMVRDKLSGLPQSYFPRAAREGEHLICVDIETNGVAHERGDILLDLAIESKAHPGLVGDWEIVQARPKFVAGNDCACVTRRYLLVTPAKSDEAQQARAIKDSAGKLTIDRAMSS